MITVDIIILLIYMAGVTLLGASFYRKNKTSSAFTLGNRNIPAWVISMSIFATFVSSISYLTLPGNAFQTNWNAFVFSLSIPIAAFIALKFFIPLYRKVNSPSAYTYLEKRFGPWARIYVSACYLLTQLMRIGTILYLLALPFHAFFGWNIAAIIIITGISVMLYSLLGGIQAVAWTDAIQGILLISGGMLGLFLLGAFSKQKNVAGAITGVIAGILAITWLSLSAISGDPAVYGNKFHTYLTIVFGTSTIFLIGFLVSLIKCKKL